MATTKIRTSDQVVVDADFSMATHKITGVVDPGSDQDAATKKYVDDKFGAVDALVYKGVIDCSANPNYPAADAGHVYKVSVAGKIGGASGQAVLAEDLIICSADSTASGTEAAVGAFWSVIHVDTNQLPTQAAQSVLANATGSVAVPTALTLAEQTLLGRITSGNIIGLTASQIHTLLNIADGATANTKATGAELDTGTDDVKFATAKALKDSHNVPSVVPSTAGNILTSDGTDWTSAAPGAAPNYATREVPSGTKNGTNPTFTLANTPVSGSEMLFLNGILLNVGAGNDYTISTNTLTMLTAAIPESTDVLLCSYRY